MKEFSMNEQEIKQAAIEFKTALINWKSREGIIGAFSTYRDQCTDEDVSKAVSKETRVVRPVLEAFEPIYRLSIQGKVEKPFSFQSYMMTYVGRVLGDELSWSEVREPYQRMINSLKGGLTTEELIDSVYYRNNLLPEHYDQAVKEIVAEVWSHNSPL